MGPDDLSFEPGEPVWIDLQTPDGSTAASTFYARLFGWRAVARHRPLDDVSGYWMFRQDGYELAGMVPGREPSWTMYIGVTDIAATVAAVAAHGGSVLVHPTPVWEAGIMANCADPFGAAFSLWQAGEDNGFARRDEPVSFAWGELSSPDPEGVMAFYGEVFGWEAKEAELVLPGVDRPVARRVPTVASESAWTVHFAVDDVDAMVARAVTLRARVLRPPTTHAHGRTAVLQDPSGASFAVVSIPRR
jgi:uncharacterized protein